MAKPLSKPLALPLLRYPRHDRFAAAPPTPSQAQLQIDIGLFHWLVTSDT